MEEMLAGDFEQKADALRLANERSLEQLEQTEALWIANLERLKTEMPHDDVAEDNRTLSYHVLLNAWSAKIMELEGLREELEGAREELNNVLLEQAD